MTTTKTNHPRSTTQKEAVLRGLEKTSGFISAQQLHQRLVEDGNEVGLATVYRQLNALDKAGHADTIPASGGQLFRACQPGEHHHLVCEGCGMAIEIDPPDESWIHASAKKNGFTVTRHILEIFGRCGQCPA